MVNTKTYTFVVVAAVTVVFVVVDIVVLCTFEAFAVVEYTLHRRS